MRTKTPWKVTQESDAYMPGTGIVTEDGKTMIASAWEDDDAEFIVKACNMHDRFVAEMEKTLAHFIELTRFRKERFPTFNEDFDDSIASIKKLIKEAKGE